MLRTRTFALAFFTLPLACSPAVPPDVDARCPGGALLMDRVTPCERTTAFGRFIVDDHGLPAFDYTLPRGDARATWTLTDGSERTDHIFSIGNDRVIGVVSTDGTVELFTRERGMAFANKRDTRTGRTAGGYSVVVTDEDAFTSAPFAAPDDATITRTFGVTGARFTTRKGLIEVTHRLSAPPGDESALLDDITLTNLSRDAKTVRHFTFFDVNRHPLEMQLLRSGTIAPEVPRDGDAVRAAVNGLFALDTVTDESGRGLRVRHTYAGTDAPARDTPSSRDFYPHDIALVRLLPDVTDAHPLRMHSVRTDALAVVENATADRDIALTADVPPLAQFASALDEPATLVDEVVLTLAPGEQATLRYAFATVPTDGTTATLVARHAAPEIDVEGRAALSVKGTLARARIEGIPHLDREMAWHSAKLLEASVYEESFGAHTIAQGSAYLFAHGLDGAARDFALFALPVIHLRPDLARDILRTLARMRHDDDHQLSYAVQGFGVLESATVHTHPSDVDLGFLWALSEYVASTGDRAFLDEVHPLWPPASGTPLSMREHARIAIRHLFDDVGTGPHGLIRVRTGDWSDGIVFLASDRAVAEEQGESIPNSQMALYVLPRAKAVLVDDPALAQEIDAFTAALRPVVEEQWNGDWYRRAWFGVDEPYGDARIDLEGQVWALIADIPSDDEREILVGHIREQLDLTSPIGARRIPDGDVWHAITGLLTWGYGRHHPDFAFESLARHSLFAFADENPTKWAGQWSSPDGIFPNGDVWASPATPMRDFPVMNQNMHALALLALLRTAGIEMTDDGALSVFPIDTSRALIVDTPLIRVETEDGVVRGEYRAHAHGTITLVVGERGGASERIVREVAPGDIVPFEVDVR
jgi:hypothetical protein